MAGGTPIADWFGMENLSKIGGFGATPMAQETGHWIRCGPRGRRTHGDLPTVDLIASRSQPPEPWNNQGFEDVVILRYILTSSYAGMCVIYVDTIVYQLYIYVDGIMKVSDKANLKRSSGIGLWSGHSSLKITIQSFS